MKILLLVLAAIILIIVAFFTYFSGFKKLKISVMETGGELLVYEEIKGDYRQSGAVMDRIYNSLLNDDGIETFKGFGIYYDNPRKVGKNELRSEAGCILEDKDRDKINDIKGKYTIRTYEKKNCITTEFPYKGKISVLFGIMKVYPALTKFAKENGFPEDSEVMEIYDIPDHKIIYRKTMVKE